MQKPRKSAMANDRNSYKIMTKVRPSIKNVLSVFCEMSVKMWQA